MKFFPKSVVILALGVAMGACGSKHHDAVEKSAAAATLPASTLSDAGVGLPDAGGGPLLDGGGIGSGIGSGSGSAIGGGSAGSGSAPKSPMPAPSPGTPTTPGR